MACRDICAAPPVSIHLGHEMAQLQGAPQALTCSSPFWHSEEEVVVRAESGGEAGLGGSVLQEPQEAASSSLQLERHHWGTAVLGEGKTPLSFPLTVHLGQVLRPLAFCSSTFHLLALWPHKLASRIPRNAASVLLQLKTHT